MSFHATPDEREDDHQEPIKTGVNQEDDYRVIHQDSDPGNWTPPQNDKRRLSPAVWEAGIELKKHGLVVLPVRTGSQAMLDLIAWDGYSIYGIAVRRIRKDTGIREITIRYDSLISRLRSLLIPARVEVQLWIYLKDSFRVYSILTGGLMARKMP
jgi:hypothetical protein